MKVDVKDLPTPPQSSPLPSMQLCTWCRSEPFALHFYLLDGVSSPRGWFGCRFQKKVWARGTECNARLHVSQTTNLLLLRAG